MGHDLSALSGQADLRASCSLASVRAMAAPKTLGEALDRSGLRREFVARRCGVKPWTVSKWIAGIHTPDASQQLVLGALLNMDAAEISGLVSPPARKAAA